MTTRRLIFRILLAFLLLVSLLILAGVNGYKFLKKQAQHDLVLNTKLAEFDEKIDIIKKGLEGLWDKAKNLYKKGHRVLDKKTRDTHPAQAVEIRLMHGGVIAGNLLEEDEERFIVEREGEKYFVEKSRVKTMEFKTRKEIEWPYRNNVVVKRTNSVVLDGRITGADGDAVTVLFAEGGGELEMEINRSDIECLMFAPVCNEEDQKREALLREQFPGMQVYREGNVTIFTDSYEPSVRAYKRTIRDLYTEIYLKFFELFRDRKQKSQHFIVIFDDYLKYAEYAITDGVPFWAVVGYFSPTDKVLVLFNAFGERMNDMIFDAIVTKTGKTVNEIAEEIKARVSKSYHLAIDGQAKDIKDRIYEGYMFYKVELQGMTKTVLRHELTHGIFHSWGIQNIILYMPPVPAEEIAKKKKEFLDAKDKKSKEELLNQLIHLRKGEDEYTEIAVAQSWLAEGMATFCETDPMGNINERRLYLFQEMVRKNEVMPIEFLTVFSEGSFVGLKPKAILNAYSESWALTTFLVARYPDAYMKYQDRLSKEKPKTDDEELAWLLELLNKDLPALEVEFKEFMDGYKKIDDPDVRRFMRWYRIWYPYR